jgi:hypothetical protein
MHALDLRHPTAVAPAFPPGSAGHAGDEDAGFQGLMQGAPGAGLVWGQRGQVGKIEASTLALGARARTDHGIRAPWPEQYAADTAGPRFRRHFSLSPSVLSEILTLVRPFKVGLFATAAATFAYCHSHFLKNPPPLDASRSPGKGQEI